MKRYKSQFVKHKFIYVDTNIKGFAIRVVLVEKFDTEQSNINLCCCINDFVVFTNSFGERFSVKFGEYYGEIQYVCVGFEQEEVKSSSDILKYIATMIKKRINILNANKKRVEKKVILI
jgi:hypothetical protein